MQLLGADTKGGFQGFEVFVVLPKWVLELERAFVELLRPLWLLLAAKDPAAHVLRFQHEDAVRREEDVVDLRCAVRCAQGDVVQAAVGLLIQLPMGEQTHQEFTDLTFDPRRLEQDDQQNQRDEPAKRAPDLRDDGGEVHFLTFSYSKIPSARSGCSTASSGFGVGRAGATGGESSDQKGLSHHIDIIGV